MTTTRRRIRANPGDGARLREEILVAAESLLVAAGNESAITMRAVAEHVGVTTPSVYLHFPDKGTLVSAVCLRAWGELGKRMRSAAAGHDDPLAALGASGRAYVDFGLQHPVQYRLLLMRPPASLHGTAETEAAGACLAEVEAGTLKCVEAGILRGDPHDLALTLWVTVHGLVTMLISSPPFPPPTNLDRFIMQTLRTTGLGSIIATRMPADATFQSSTRLVNGVESLVDHLSAQ